MSTALRTRLPNGVEVRVRKRSIENRTFEIYETVAYCGITDNFEEARAIHDAVVRVLKEHGATVREERDDGNP